MTIIQFDFTVLHNSKPSISGITTSLTIKFTKFSSNIRKASSPLTAVRTIYSCDNCLLTKESISGLSSTTNTVYLFSLFSLSSSHFAWSSAEGSILLTSPDSIVIALSWVSGRVRQNIFASSPSTIRKLPRCSSAKERESASQYLCRKPPFHFPPH